MIGADKFAEHLTDKQQRLHATQRYQQGISEIDMWNFDTFLADVIVAGCDRMIAEGNTSPWHLAEGDWHKILKKIRKGFSYRDDLGVPKPSKKAWKLLRDNYKYMWD